MVKQDKKPNNTLLIDDIREVCQAVLTTKKDIARHHVQLAKLWLEYFYTKVTIDSTIDDKLSTTYPDVAPAWVVLHFKCWLKSIALDNKDRDGCDRVVDLFKPRSSVSLDRVYNYFYVKDNGVLSENTNFITYLNNEVMSIHVCRFIDEHLTCRVYH